MTNDAMPVPEWAEELKDKFFDSQQVLADAKLDVCEKLPVLCFSTFFAEWEPRKDDILIHFFPRAGATDVWSDGHYVNRCRNCRSEVPPASARENKACERCGHLGRIYVPGRRELRAEIKFPTAMQEILLKAADSVWEGDVAIESIPELGAYVVQFQDAGSVPSFDQPGGMLDRFFESVDREMEAKA